MMRDIDGGNDSQAFQQFELGGEKEEVSKSLRSVGDGTREETPAGGVSFGNDIRKVLSLDPEKEVEDIQVAREKIETNYGRKGVALHISLGEAVASKLEAAVLFSIAAEEFGKNPIFLHEGIKFSLEELYPEGNMVAAILDQAQEKITEDFAVALASKADDEGKSVVDYIFDCLKEDIYSFSFPEIKDYVGFINSALLPNLSSGLGLKHFVQSSLLREVFKRFVLELRDNLEEKQQQFLTEFGKTKELRLMSLTDYFISSERKLYLHDFFKDKDKVFNYAVFPNEDIPLSFFLSKQEINELIYKLQKSRVLYILGQKYKANYLQKTAEEICRVFEIADDIDLNTLAEINILTLLEKDLASDFCLKTGEVFKHEELVALSKHLNEIINRSHLSIITPAPVDPNDLLSLPDLPAFTAVSGDDSFNIPESDPFLTPEDLTAAPHNGVSVRDQNQTLPSTQGVLTTIAVTKEEKAFFNNESASKTPTGEQLSATSDEVEPVPVEFTTNPAEVALDEASFYDEEDEGMPIHFTEGVKISTPEEASEVTDSLEMSEPAYISRNTEPLPEEEMVAVSEQDLLDAIKQEVQEHLPNQEIEVQIGYGNENAELSESSLQNLPKTGRRGVWLMVKNIGLAVFMAFSSVSSNNYDVRTANVSNSRAATSNTNNKSLVSIDSKNKTLETKNDNSPISIEPYKSKTLLQPRKRRNKVAANSNVQKPQQTLNQQTIVPPSSARSRRKAAYAPNFNFEKVSPVPRNKKMDWERKYNYVDAKSFIGKMDGMEKIAAPLAKALMKKAEVKMFAKGEGWIFSYGAVVRSALKGKSSRLNRATSQMWSLVNNFNKAKRGNKSLRSQYLTFLSRSGIANVHKMKFGKTYQLSTDIKGNVFSEGVSEIQSILNEKELAALPVKTNEVAANNINPVNVFEANQDELSSADQNLELALGAYEMALSGYLNEFDFNQKEDDFTLAVAPGELLAKDDFDLATYNYERALKNHKFEEDKYEPESLSKGLAPLDLLQKDDLELAVQSYENALKTYSYQEPEELSEQKNWVSFLESDKEKIANFLEKQRREVSKIPNLSTREVLEKLYATLDENHFVVDENARVSFKDESLDYLIAEAFSLKEGESVNKNLLKAKIERMA